MKPAIGPGLTRGFGLVQIAFEETETRIGAGAPYLQFAGFVRAAQLAVVTDDTAFEPDRGFAETGGADLARLMSGHDDAAHPGFGHGPAFHQRKAETLFESLMIGATDPRAKTEAYVMVAIGAAGRHAHQNGRHHTEIMNDRGLRFAHRFPPSRGMKTINQHDGAAGENHRHA